MRSHGSSRSRLKKNDSAAPADEAKKKSDLADYKEVFEEQREHLVRHLQQFLKSPMFIDLSQSPVEVSDGKEAIEERMKDLDYRIKVLTSIITLLTEEREGLDRAVPAGTLGDGPSDEAHDAGA